MELKKIIICILIIILCFTGQLYLKSIYNPNVSELHFRGHITREEILELDKELKSKTYNINYESHYENYNLIMTTGKDMKIKKLNILQGNYNIDNKVKTAVIGDKVADHFFKQINGVNREITINDRKYIVKGIIKDSKDLYILYDEDLTKLNWRKKVINYISTEEDRRYYLEIEKLQTKLKSMEIDVFDTIVYREKINGYMNVIVLVLLYILLSLLVKLVKVIRIKLNIIIEGYKKEKRIITWYEYVWSNKVKVSKALGKIIIAMILAWGVYKIVPKLQIPPNIIPDNLFSLFSYIRLIKLNYNKFILHLTNGYSDILVDSIKLNITFIIISIASILIYKRIRKKRAI